MTTTFIVLLTLLASGIAQRNEIHQAVAISNLTGIS